jgi:hypothetical protein
MSDADEMREGVRRCPNGCSFDELEIGTESQSFSALLGAPFLHIRCGQCGFDVDPTTGRENAIAAWNKAAEAKQRESADGK